MATQAEIDTLKAAIASGVLSVQYGDKVIRYQSTEAMLAALAKLEADLAGAGASGSRSTYAGFQSG